MILTLIGIVSIMAVWWGVPLFFISLSERTTRKEKSAWSLAILFFSWFAFIIYLIYISMKKMMKIGYINEQIANCAYKAFCTYNNSIIQII